MLTRDQNGQVLTMSLRPEGDGWGVTVWFGGINGLGTNVQRHIYKTRGQARRGDISTDVGQRGRIG